MRPSNRRHLSGRLPNSSYQTLVLNGELDTQIEAAANKLRDGFAQ